MGRLTRYQRLPDSPSDARITDLSRPLRPPVSLDPVTGAPTGDGFRNRNVANSTPIQLVGGAQSVRVLPANPRRTGMLIQNKDPTASLYFSFGVAADINSPFLQAGQFVLLDFTTPASELYLYATANVVASVTDMTRQQ